MGQNQLIGKIIRIIQKRKWWDSGLKAVCIFLYAPLAFFMSKLKYMTFSVYHNVFM